MTSRGWNLLHHPATAATLVSSMWLLACQQSCSLQSALRFTPTSYPPVPVLPSSARVSQRIRGGQEPKASKTHCCCPLLSLGFSWSLLLLGSLFSVVQIPTGPVASSTVLQSLSCSCSSLGDLTVPNCLFLILLPWLPSAAVPVLDPSIDYLPAKSLIQ